MSVITSSAFAKALWPGIHSWYGKAYNEWPEEWSQLFEVKRSTKQYEEDVGISSFGLAKVKPEGEAITYDSERQAFLTRYTHVVYANGFIITREMREDDQYAVAGERKSQGLAFSMRQTKETVAANVYNRAFNSTYAGGDGKELLATDHPNFAGGTWANELSTAADLSEASLEQSVIDIAKFTNDRGLRMKAMPNQLIVPVDLMFEARRILKSVGRPSSADNDVNALKDMGMFPGGVIVNHYLTDADAFFMRTSVSNGMCMYQRRKMEMGIDNEFETENAKYKSSERYSFGWTDPRGIYGSPGA